MEQSQNSKTAWKGGTLAGSIRRRARKSCTWWEVSFDPSAGVQKSKCFSVGKYGSEEMAEQAAMDYRKQTSDNNGLTKNRIRYVNSGSSKYAEIELQNKPESKEKFIGLLDIDDIKLLNTGYAWFAYPNPVQYYMQCSVGNKHGNQQMIAFHRLLYPEWRIIDHINRNSLDNRRNNLRDGGNSINEMNRNCSNDNSSSIVGVSRRELKNGNIQWSAHIEFRGKRLRKSWSELKWGAETAKELAISQRKKWADEFGNYNGRDPPEIKG